ncbi:hypothetical protein C1D09_004695 [Mesorhizobium intechi]|nr:hypothetical protein C1D09_004695 [Mesorhizobium intechi]
MREVKFLLVGFACAVSGMLSLITLMNGPISPTPIRTARPGMPQLRQDAATANAVRSISSRCVQAPRPVVLPLATHLLARPREVALGPRHWAVPSSVRGSS